MFLSDEAVSSFMKRMEERFICRPSHKAVLFRGMEEEEEEEDGGMGGLMFLSEEAAPQTDSSVSIASGLKTRILI